MLQYSNILIIALLSLFLIDKAPDLGKVKHKPISSERSPFQLCDVTSCWHDPSSFIHPVNQSFGKEGKCSDWFVRKEGFFTAGQDTWRDLMLYFTNHNSLLLIVSKT